MNKELIIAIQEALDNSIKNGYGDEDVAMTDEELAYDLLNKDSYVELVLMRILIEHVKHVREIRN